MQKYIVVTSLLFSMLAGQALAQSKASQDERKPPPRPEFSSIDSNDDGIVELSEFAALPHRHDDYKSIFSHIDTDEDGVISKQEFTDHKPPRKKKKMKEKYND